MRSSSVTASRPGVIAYVGLGSNLGVPENQVRGAFQALDALPESRVVARSSLYRSRPLGPQDQPQYINAVVAVETILGPQRLLAGLQAIEAAHGRVRGGQRWGPRTLDLDLLLYGELELQTERLILPHPALPQRDFVLYPLLEVAGGNLQIPSLGALRRLLANCPRRGLERLKGNAQD